MTAGVPPSRLRVSVVAALACMLATLACQGAPEYTVTVRNVSSTDALDAGVEYGDFRSQRRSLRPGDHTREFPVTDPPPGQATVSWRTPEGVAQRDVVAPAPLPADFEGELVFEIGDGARARVYVRPDEQGRPWP